MLAPAHRRRERQAREVQSTTIEKFEVQASDDGQAAR